MTTDQIETVAQAHHCMLLRDEVSLADMHEVMCHSFGKSSAEDVQGARIYADFALGASLGHVAVIGTLADLAALQEKTSEPKGPDVESFT